tara:strand:- start:210 stop:362 length:153 start_codon:yes stop_codon:yes gene_type:complete
LEKDNVIDLLDFGSIELNEIDRQFIALEKQKILISNQTRLINEKPNKEKD